MKSIYIPKKLFDILESNPDFSAAEIKEFMKCSRATAFRYRKNYKSFTENRNEDLIHHKINRVKIETWKSIYNQEDDLKSLLDIVLNENGFRSTNELREDFYKKHPEYKHQSNRNFNHYFKRIRDKIIKEKYKLEILQSKIKTVGFCTQINSNFKPTD
jgi:hypothetical protein